MQSKLVGGKKRGAASAECILFGTSPGPWTRLVSSQKKCAGMRAAKTSFIPCWCCVHHCTAMPNLKPVRSIDLVLEGTFNRPLPAG